MSALITMTSFLSLVLFAVVGSVTALAPFVSDASACGGQVRVTYREAAPDTIVVEFLDGPAAQLDSLAINLSPSVGRAFVDTAYGSSKSNDANAAVLESLDGFGTGMRHGTMRFSGFSRGQTFKFIVDLDDEAEAGDYNQDVLDNGEIMGTLGTAELLGADGTRTVVTGTFNREGVALLGQPACV